MTRAAFFINENGRILSTGRYHFQILKKNANQKQRTFLSAFDEYDALVAANVGLGWVSVAKESGILFIRFAPHNISGSTLSALKKVVVAESAMELKKRQDLEILIVLFPDLDQFHGEEYTLSPANALKFLDNKSKWKTKHKQVKVKLK